MEGKQAVEWAVKLGWVSEADAAELEGRLTPPAGRGIEYDVVFEAVAGDLTKATIRVYNPNNAKRGGGAGKKTSPR